MQRRACGTFRHLDLVQAGIVGLEVATSLPVHSDASRDQIRLARSDGVAGGQHGLVVQLGHEALVQQGHQRLGGVPGGRDIRPAVGVQDDAGRIR